jgi:hypothetical protein
MERWERGEGGSCGLMFADCDMATSSALKWDKLEDTTIPEVDIMRINDYFITRMVDDGMPAKDYNSHSYPLFKADHIQSVS